MKITQEDLRKALEAKEQEYELHPANGFVHPSFYPIRMNQVAIHAFVRQDSSRRDPNLKIIQAMMDRLWKEGAMRYDE